MIIKNIINLFRITENFSFEERRELANAQREAFELIISSPQVYDRKRDVHDKNDFERVVDNIDWLNSFLTDNRAISEIDSLWPNVANRKKQIRKRNDDLIRSLMHGGFKEDDAIEIASFSKSCILRNSINHSLETVIEVITEQNNLFCEILEDPTLSLLDEVFLSVKKNSLPIMVKDKISK